MNEDARHHVKLKNGKIYISSSLYDLYFSGIQTVVFLNTDDKRFLLPLNQDGGSGLLLKIVNSRGDRVVNVVEQLLEIGIDDSFDQDVFVTWDKNISGLYLHLKK